MARILLVKLSLPLSEWHTQIAATPPLGLMSLASHARQVRPGKDEFILLDERLEFPTTDYYRRLLDTFRPDYIALSVLSTEADRYREVVPLLREVAPDTRLIVGGPHVSAVGSQLLAQEPRAFLVRGEGEKAFVALLNAWDQDRTYPEEPISGLVYRTPNGEVREWPYNQDLVDVEALPLPAWDLVDLEKYRTVTRMTSMVRGRRYAVLFTSRGCPYRCTYCHDIFTKKFRAQSPMKVVDEIQYLIEHHNVYEFEILDDIFNADYKRTMAICDEISRRGLKTRFSFPNGVRGDRMDEPLIKALASVGTTNIGFAVESANQGIQKQIRKHVKLEKLARAISYAVKERIFTTGFFMLGFPGETRSNMEQTLDFAVNTDLHMGMFFTVIPFAGTALAKENPEASAALDPFNHIPHTDSLDDAGPHGNNGATASARTNHHYATNRMSELTPAELLSFKRKAYLKFYTQPRRMLRIVKDYPHGYPNLLRSGAKFFHYTWSLNRGAPS